VARRRGAVVRAGSRPLSGGSIVDALAALSEGKSERARAISATVDSELGRALTAYLGSGANGSVYDRPAAFRAFIDGGGNVGLYEAVSTALARLSDDVRPAVLLDVGCGDGRALVPALLTGHRPSRLTLVEPSAALLDVAVRRVAEELGGDDGVIEVDAHHTTVQRFVAEAGAFALAQSTFALSALPPADRDGVLAALSPKVGVLAVVEFDVPDRGGVERLRFLADTYERGLAEYGADRALVAQGFLMPVLTGQLLPGAIRSTWEQPAAAWAEQVSRAGFIEVRHSPLYGYWSSPAFLLTASGRS